MEHVGLAISVVSALVALLSAIYARRQASSASKANEISLHENRLNIYKSLVRFRAHISALGASIKEEDVWLFGEASEMAEFYFPENIAERMKAVFENARKLLSQHEEWRELQNFDHSQAKAMVAPMQALMKDTRDECYSLSDAIKPLLRVGAA
jgi:hypothetical protein